MSEININCPCKRTKCERYGNCEVCREHHKASKHLAACDRINAKAYRKKKENKIIDEALGNYKMINPEAILIRHNENMTYKVTDNNDSYLLRIHRPAEGLDFSLNYNANEKYDFIKGEIDLLRTLIGYDNAMFQCPVKNKNGEYVTKSEKGELITVLNWIDGDTLVNTDITDELSYEIGQMIGRFHNISKQIHSVKRCSYGEKYMNNVLLKLNAAYDLNHIDKDSYKIIIEVMSIIINTVEKEKNNFILIHSDLSKSNIIYNGSIFCPIDFSLSGYGLREMEIAQMILSINKREINQSLIDGYEKTCGYKLNKEYIRIFMSLSIILYVAIHHNKLFEDEKFKKALKRWSDTFFLPLLNK